MSLGFGRIEEFGNLDQIVAATSKEGRDKFIECIAVHAGDSMRLFPWKIPSGNTVPEAVRQPWTMFPSPSHVPFVDFQRIACLIRRG